MADNHSSFFSKVMATKSSAELEIIVEDDENYTQEAQLAAISELKNRGSGLTHLHTLEDQLVEQNNAEKERKEAFYKEARAPEGMPKQILWASYLLMVSLSISLAGTIFLISQSLIHQSSFGWVFNFIIYAFLFLSAHSAGIGKNWARIMFLIFFVFSSIYTLSLLSVLVYIPILALGIQLVHFVLSLIAIIFLFSGEAARWFHSRKYDSDLLDD
jgi:hypothetical protein